MRFVILVIVVLLLSQPTLADCINPDGSEGAIVYNSAYNVPEVCNGTNWMALGQLNPSAGGSGCINPNRPEGTIIYNTTHHVLQYCDGDDWQAAHGFDVDGPACSPPASCPNVGDVCSDGSLFAGFMIYNNSSCEALYVTNDNQAIASAEWKTTTGTDDINPDDYVDGKANAANRAGNIANFPAFDLCESSTYHGKSDWYLPARYELHMLWKNRSAIDANAAGAFTTGTYFSSTELNLNSPFELGFANGSEGPHHFKTNPRAVRCVRRD